MLRGRRIVIGVSGGIAAYKTCELVRLCVKEGAEVQVMMTPNATQFVQPLTFEALSGREVVVDAFDRQHATSTEHIALARWGELVVIAPATANTLAKAAHGIADNFVTATILSTLTPVVFVPAMNTAMWNAPATRRNRATLAEYGYVVTPTGSGELACGEEGDGRMLEPRQIMDHLVRALPKAGPLKGKRVMVTAGPTPEPIDPVRLITNRSSGKMGVALAQEAVGMGAEVVFVHGPIQVDVPWGAECVAVGTAEEMHGAIMDRIGDADALVMAAAVADFRPETVSEQKIKKADAGLTLTLTRTRDILQHVGEVKTKQFVVGFAMESDPAAAAERARDRLTRKNLDMIALNVIGEPGAGFGVDTNHVTLFFRDGRSEDLALMSKREVAGAILRHVAEGLRLSADGA